MVQRNTPNVAELEVVGVKEIVKDAPSVTREGKALFEPIDGVRVRPAVTQVDERGSLCEMFSPAWGFDDAPLVYVYQTSILPGYVKGWVVHLEQDDRLFFPSGRVRVVLYDGRQSSPTFQRLNRFETGELNRVLLRIPAGVYHAVQNLGSTEAFYYNMPTQPYRHEDPDKFRLPLDNESRNARGW
jgi:dTDP-4-dehydrorhamnose 3,5-epimerase